MAKCKINGFVITLLRILPTVNICGSRDIFLAYFASTRIKFPLLEFMYFERIYGFLKAALDY